VLPLEWHRIDREAAVILTSTHLGSGALNEATFCSQGQELSFDWGASRVGVRFLSTLRNPKRRSRFATAPALWMVRLSISESDEMLVDRPTIRSFHARRTRADTRIIAAKGEEQLLLNGTSCMPSPMRNVFRYTNCSVGDGGLETARRRRRRLVARRQSRRWLSPVRTTGAGDNCVDP
jgi:hypothetical protein